MSIEILPDELKDLEDLAPRSIKVPYKGKHYLLIEANSDALVRYENARLKATKFTNDGKLATLDGLADTEPLLVSCCLAQTNPDGTMKVQKVGDVEHPVTVPLAVVRSWPGKVVRRLFDLAKKLSDLDDKDTVEIVEKRIEADRKKLEALKKGNGDVAKNEQDATTDGSD